MSQRAYSDIENNKTKLDLDRLERLSNIFEMDALELLTFDEKKVFNNTSKGLFADKILDDNFENERQFYQQQIKHLEEEILFLRNLIHKN
nr:helix-turn-helix transcriptional regulator [Chryseobacterium daeguense]